MPLKARIFYFCRVIIIPVSIRYLWSLLKRRQNMKTWYRLAAKGFGIMVLLLTILLLPVFNAPLFGAQSGYSCSVQQGFNFEKNEQVIVGHITYLKIGGKELKADISVTDPENVRIKRKVFGVLSAVYWNGGYADPVQFSLQISTDNKNTIAAMQHKSLSNTEVEVEFNVYDYDPKAKKYFKAFHSNNVRLKGLIQKSGGELAFRVNMDQNMEVVSPKNYTLSIGVMPQDIFQNINLAVSVSNKWVKAWGVTVAK